MTKRIIHHHYQDHANAIPPDRTTSDAQGHTFIYKLHATLEDVEQQGLSRVVSWQPHGRCFVVHDAKEFEKNLPRYFKLTKIASFQRQLNIYGFCRITKGVDRGAYYHECFLRGMTWLAPKIVRIKVKGTLVRRKSNPDEEPDFWSMSWVSPSGLSKARALSCDQTEATGVTTQSTSLSLVLSGSQASLQNGVFEETSMKMQDYGVGINQITAANALFRSGDRRDRPDVCHDAVDPQPLAVPSKFPVLEDHIDRALTSVNIREVFDDFLLNDWMLMDL
ncbi:hypothetical protein FisN_31Lh041 [Fistulifera solaris]|uniref:HSF-type DNA-binding domain-containing protein n=1 Tax=Fistulifera solaris TaxID=1519565 RepID=A0A1Z5K636_FISSO|nr:hypothetical protein FisN_31Lh041 [Fistulifera solaris]|eukprot:GAX21753.1 hypothetical protein FisN_31Lh041 [Fistulifera solaris]